jgi:hypothetical protein
VFLGGVLVGGGLVWLGGGVCWGGGGGWCALSQNSERRLLASSCLSVSSSVSMEQPGSHLADFKED